MKIDVQNLNAWFKENHALRGVTLGVPQSTVLAIIGPSGCGKSTFVRCLNRMHELVPGSRQTGRVLVDGQDLHARGRSGRVKPARAPRWLWIMAVSPKNFRH